MEKTEEEIKNLHGDLKNAANLPGIFSGADVDAITGDRDGDILVVELRVGNKNRNLAIFRRVQANQYSLLPVPELAPSGGWGRLRIVQYVMGAFAVLGMAWPLGLAHLEFGKGFEKNDCIKVIQAVVLCFWILAPPIWFWVEYFFLYEPEKPQLKPEYERFKYGQDQSAKVWLALVTILLGLYFGKDFAREPSPSTDQKGGPPPAQCVPCPCWHDLLILDVKSR